MSEQKLRWGILGAARIAVNRVMPAIQESSNGQLYGIAARDPERARETASKLSVPQVYETYEALLADPQVQAVYIPLPNHLHAEWTIKALKAGKHVLCEKPLALSAKQCDEMIAAAKEANVTFAEAFMYRFHPQVDWTCAQIMQGTIGQVHLIRSAFTFRLVNREDDIRLQASMGGGGLMDVGCYCVNVSRLLFAAEPVEVQAMAKYGEHSRVDEVFAGLLRFPNDQLALFDCGLRAVGRQDVEVVGSEGSIYIPTAFLPGANDAYVRLRRGGQSEEVRIPGANHYRLMAEDFVAAVQEGRSPRFSAEEGRANMAVIEALAVSARSGHAMRPAKPVPPKPKQEEPAEKQGEEQKPAVDKPEA